MDGLGSLEGPVPGGLRIGLGLPWSHEEESAFDCKFWNVRQLPSDGHNPSRFERGEVIALVSNLSIVSSALSGAVVYGDGNNDHVHGEP